MLMNGGINYRVAKGYDIDAACGQLESKQIKKEKARLKRQKHMVFPMESHVFFYTLLW